MQSLNKKVKQKSTRELIIGTFLLTQLAYSFISVLQIWLILHFGWYSILINHSTSDHHLKEISEISLNKRIGFVWNK